MSNVRGSARETTMKADDATTAAILEVTRSFMAAYEAKDVDGVMAHIAPDDDVVLIGTGEDEKRVGPAQVRLQVERDHEQTEKIAMRLSDPVVSARGEVAWLTGDVRFDGVADDEAFTIGGRMTAVFENRGGTWLLVNSHYSAPLADQAAGDSFPVPG